jgi:4-amino-4-deoxy-L-arabinose transferase-like glycosyltransferase
VGRDVFLRLIAPAAPLNFDEAAHSLPGYYMLRDIRNLNVHAFWGDFHIQTLWPPGFSMLQAPFLAILGRTDDAARVFAYIMLVFTLVMACAIAYQIKPEYASIAGFVSGLISLSAPGWLFTGSWAMQETPVASVVFCVFWLFLRALQTRKMMWFVWTGVGLFFLFLTKYNYAAFALAAIGLVDVKLKIENALLKRNVRALFLNSQLSLINSLGLYVPFALGLLMWFFTGTDIAPTAVKWRDFSFFVSNENSGYPFWSEQNLLFYVRAMLNWLMPHPLLAIAALLGAGWAVARVRHPGVTLLAIFFVLGFVLATVHQLKAERYMTPLFPSLWLLTGIGAADALDRLTQNAKRRMILRLATCVGLLVLAAWSWLMVLPKYQPVWAGHLADDLRSASNQIVQWQQGNQSVLIIGTFGELSPPLFEWRLRPQPAFSNTPYPIQYDAPPVEGPDDIARVQRWLDENPGAQVTLIALADSSPLYQTNDMKNKNAWRQQIVRRWGEVTGYRKVDEVAYPQSGMTVSYWLPE